VLDLRPVGAGDLDACLALSAEAGWNQNSADWRTIVARGHVVGLRAADGRLLATAAVLPYEPFAWICMVLVAASERRRGHATRLMQHCIEWAGERGLIAGLDATPAGREVYRTLGFEDVYGLTRLQAPKVSVQRLAPADVDIASLTAAELAAVAGYDAEIFGADRAPLLAELCSRVPRAAFVARRGGPICGFVLARDGRLATQIGPVVADDEAVARALMSHAFENVQGAVFVDIADRHRDVRAWLDGLGFIVQRPYTRMLLGRSEPLDRPESIVAITGPEFA
jgi:GNAT superfamily N-acetyltransferase